MLEVHPPHQAAHTWKDFFIHIATISVGLLIAIGLEQTVESFHHRHQRHQLEEDLHHEGLRNRELVEHDFAYLRFGVQRLEEAARAVRAAGTLDAAANHYPGDYHEQVMALGLRYLAPSASVWTTARDSGAVGLLPREEAQMYARLYRVREVVIAVDLELRKTRITTDAVQSRLAPTPDGVPDVANISAGDRQQLLAALMQERAADLTLVSLLRAFRGTNEAVLGGAHTEDEAAEALIGDKFGMESPKGMPAASAATH
jgi:hypothetical protein